ncbi:GNAT family N-acetyltransferase [Streptomyces sp. NPDC058268]|uniref:GNAT family N-acetyltransferase n=1 Tax=Streptomyces sp. NPDC058268 TaxID=3346413 RepID=UPI0036EDCB86
MTSPQKAIPGGARPAITEHPATDIDQLASLWAELLAHHVHSAPHLGDLGEVRSAAESWTIRRGEYLAWLEDPLARILTASVDDRIVGYAFVRIVPAAGSWKLGEQVGVLETLVVAGEARGRGLGRQLLEAAEAHCHEHGVTTLRISVIEGNDAQGFYHRRGAVGFTRTLLLPVPGIAAAPIAHDAETDTVLDRLLSHAELALREGAFGRADALFTHVLGARREVGTTESLQYLAVLHDHALVAYGQGRWADGEARMRRVLEGREELAGPMAAETVGAMARLAEAIGEQGRWEEAESVAREAVRRAETGLTAGHEEALAAQLGLSWVLVRTGAKEAEEILWPLQTAMAQSLGRRHRTAMSARHLMVQLLRDQRRYTEALDIAEELATTRAQSLGPEHAHTLRAQADRAVLLHRVGRTEEAAALARETQATSTLVTELLGTDQHHDQKIRSALLEITTSS